MFQRKVKNNYKALCQSASQINFYVLLLVFYRLKCQNEADGRKKAKERLQWKRMEAPGAIWSR